MTAQRTALDSHRWHWSHGPIDIVAEAYGDPAAVADAHEAAWQRFGAVLGELVGELRLLRQPVGTDCVLRGPIARRMWNACAPFRPAFITPMAAVAGSVAQELIGFYQRPGIERAWLNNGGDIALHLAPGQSARVGLFADISRFDLRDAGRVVNVDGSFDVTADMPVRGVATSGWRGRSFSLGIADSVTVLAATSAQADAAATVIANAVDVQDAGIHRRPASECKDDTDLGDIPVTVGVDMLAAAQVRRALDAGAARAHALQQAGLIFSAVLVCQHQYRVAEPLCSTAAVPNAASAMAIGSVFA
ncbi:UPF0280 family protein [Variovorax humicola]|uniref:UPF0280 family protein n=1 Tax=Variovorax humicola TaxID=1769758 RepID=A0ABU8VWG0_9BURK